MYTSSDAERLRTATAIPASVPNAARQRVALLAASVWLAGSLAGCGGGGGGGGAPIAAPPVSLAPAPGPAPAPAPGALGPSYLVAGISSSETTGPRVLVTDAEAARAEAVLNVPVQGTTAMVSTVSYNDDPATRAIVIRGSPMTFFVNSGQLWQIDLATSRNPASLRISSLNDVCDLQMVAPLDNTGLDAWVLVGTAGADGNCQTGADNRQAFVRSGTAATVAPYVVPAGIQAQQLYLSGARGALWWMLALDRSGTVPRLVAYAPNLNIVEVAGGSGIQSVNAKGNGTDAGEGTYIRTGADLRRIDASTTALSIGAPQLRFNGSSFLTLYERPVQYFTDENTVYKVEGTAPATPLVRLAGDAGPVMLLAQSTDKLLIRQGDLVSKAVVSAVDKQTGAVTPLLTQPDGISNAVWALRGRTVFYFTGDTVKAGALRRVELDGSDDALIATNLLIVGRVTSRLWNRGQTTVIGGTSALLACQPLPGGRDCRGSTLLQIDMETRSIIPLGNFAVSTAIVWLAQGGNAYEGVKGAVVEVQSRTGAADAPFARRDLYVFNPGEANSLKLVSPTTP